MTVPSEALTPEPARPATAELQGPWPITDHGARPGPQYWDWRCLTCSQEVRLHAPLWWRLWRRLRGG